jgi:hypothetical protein
MKVLDEWCPVPQDNSKFQDEHIREVGRKIIRKHIEALKELAK